MNIDGLVDRIAAAVVERLKPAPKPKPTPRPAVPPRVETELERVQRHFDFLREHPECGFPIRPPWWR